LKTLNIQQPPCNQARYFALSMP